MKFLFFTLFGEVYPIAHRVKREGNEVMVVPVKRSAHLWDGIVETSRKWGEFLTKETVVVFDRPGGERTAHRLRSQGFAVVGGGDGEVEDDSSEFYEGWFNGEEFGLIVKAKMMKRFCEGEKGPKVECAGAIITPVLERVEELEKVKEELMGYCGPVRVTEKGVSTGFSFEEVFGVLALVGDVGKFLYSLSHREKLPEVTQCSAVLPVLLPLAPFARSTPFPDKYAGRSVKVLKSSVEKGQVVLRDIELVEGKIVTSPWARVAADAVGVGKEAREAAESALCSAKKIVVEEGTYRTDIMELIR